MNKAKYNKLYNKYMLLKELHENKRPLNISLLTNNTITQYIEINNIDMIDCIRNKIKTYITDIYKSPEFKFGLGEDDEFSTHINTYFKHHYIELINGMVISNRKHFIHEILKSMNITIDSNKSYNTIVLEKKISTIDSKINKYRKIIDTIGMIEGHKYINRITTLLEYIDELTLNKKIIIFIINHINKYYKIYYNIDRKPIDNTMKGKEVENIINSMIIKLLQNKIDMMDINCDILYISNIDYNKMIHNMDKNDNLNFKQELDGLICIKTIDAMGQIYWYPVVIIESKVNLNLIYTDINKLNSLHTRLQGIKNFTINYLENDDVKQYNIIGTGFKSCDLYYCVHEMNNIIDHKYIKFIYDNYFSKSIIYEIIINKITENINCDTLYLFNNIEDLDNFIMNRLKNNKYNYNFSKMIDCRNKMKTELIENIMKIKKGCHSDMFDRILSPTVYSCDTYNYFNYNKNNKSIYKYLKSIDVITMETIDVIKNKLDQISEPFIEFNNRIDTLILHIN